MQLFIVIAALPDKEIELGQPMILFYDIISNLK